MNIPVEKRAEATSTFDQKSTIERDRRFWFMNWEIYPLLLLTIFLRFFGINTTVFGDDEAVLFQLSHDAVAHGLLPIMADRASVGGGVFHPALSLYFYMLPALFSPSPLGGQILVAIINTLAVLVTYIFVRRYFGRLAGTIAALLYATSVGAWTYSRSIWSPNLIPLFVILFIFSLFLGVVERRKGWIILALPLMSILYQLHETSILLVSVLLLALLFAWRTLRLGPILLGLGAMLLVSLPYLAWEVKSHFIDLFSAFKASGGQIITNRDVLHTYLFFLHPTLFVPYIDPSARARDNHILLSNAQSILYTTPLRHLQLSLKLAFYTLVAIFLVGLVLLCWRLLLPERNGWREQSRSNPLLRWWYELLASPRRTGLALLLCWQLFPLFFLLRHSVTIFTHYIIFLIPGPFILTAVGLTSIIELVRQYKPDWRRYARYGVSGLAALLILAQTIGCTVALIDQTAGNFTGSEVSPTFNALSSLEGALHTADQIAQQRHIHRIYITTDTFSLNHAMRYLTDELQTPASVESISNCLSLPAAQAGPVVLLTESQTAVDDEIVRLYGSATLVATSPRLGTSPFRIFVVTMKATPPPVAQNFAQQIQLLSPTAPSIYDNGKEWLLTRWQLANTLLPAPRTQYHFEFHLRPDVATAEANDLACDISSAWAGDQFFVYENALALSSGIPAQLVIRADFHREVPILYHVGSLTLTLAKNQDVSIQKFQTADRQHMLYVPVAP